MHNKIRGKGTVERRKFSSCLSYWLLLVALPELKGLQTLISVLYTHELAG